MNIGDRVRLKEDYGSFFKGVEGVVSDIAESNPNPSHVVWKVGIGDYNIHVFADRLEVIPEEPKEATDRELAATFRESFATFVEAKKLLIDRGYDVQTLSNPPTAFITKTQKICL